MTLLANNAGIGSDGSAGNLADHIIVQIRNKYIAECIYGDTVRHIELGVGSWSV